MDVEKAFDRLWHNGLLMKMIDLRIPNWLIHLIKSFLSDRSFRVKVKDSLSDPLHFDYGSPQGSVLSPLLYNIFTSDLPTDKFCEIALYADDTAIMTSSRFVKQIDKKINDYYMKLTRYFTKWKILINGGKTQGIFFTKRKTKQLPTHPLKLGKDTINWGTSLKYLGYIFDAKLTQITHIEGARKKADKMISLVYPLINRRCAVSVNVKVLIYKSYIRPILTYANQLTTRASRTQFGKLVTKENKLLRMIVDVPYDYSAKATRDLAGVESLTDFSIRTIKNFVDKCKNHDNPLIKSLY